MRHPPRALKLNGSSVPFDSHSFNVQAPNSLSLPRLHDHLGHPRSIPRAAQALPAPCFRASPAVRLPVLDLRLSPRAGFTSPRPQPFAPLARGLSPLEEQPHGEHARRQREHREDVPGPRVAVAVAWPLEVGPAHVLGQPEALAPQPAPQQTQGSRRRCRHLTPTPRPPPPQLQLPPRPTEPAGRRPRGGAGPAATPFRPLLVSVTSQPASSAGPGFFTAHPASPPTSLTAASPAVSPRDSALRPRPRPSFSRPASTQPWSQPHSQSTLVPPLFATGFGQDFPPPSLSRPATATPLISGIAPLWGHSSQSSQLKLFLLPGRPYLSLALSLPPPSQPPSLTWVYRHLSWSRLLAAFFLLPTLFLSSCPSMISTPCPCISLKMDF